MRCMYMRCNSCVHRLFTRFNSIGCPCFLFLCLLLFSYIASSSSDLFSSNLARDIVICVLLDVRSVLLDVWSVPTSSGGFQDDDEGGDDMYN